MANLEISDEKFGNIRNSVILITGKIVYLLKTNTYSLLRRSLWYWKVYRSAVS
jgi:hypothetical protein